MSEPKADLQRYGDEFAHYKAPEFLPGQTQDRVREMFVRQAPNVPPEDRTAITPAPRSTWAFALAAMGVSLLVVGAVGVGMWFAEVFTYWKF